MKDVVKIPEDLLLALKRDQYAYDFFMQSPPSHKKAYIKWIEEAKRPETRTKRIHEAVVTIREKREKGSISA